MSEEINGRCPGLIKFRLEDSDILTEVFLPPWAKRIRFQFLANAGKLALEGSDGEEIGTVFASIPADIWFDLNLSLTCAKYSSRESVFLASSVDETVVEIIVES